MCSECQVFSLESDIIIELIPTVEQDVKNSEEQQEINSVADPIPTVESIIETPKKQEEIDPSPDPIRIIETTIETPRREEKNVPVSANTRSAKKKKISVMELGELLKQSVNLEKGQSEADPCDAKRKKRKTGKLIDANR